ncbi:tail fiber domain-containing protein [Cronobacter sakazakii]|uniref:tail fiber domain-containing protein n=1 Tax=Cronobacter sakazakii TaxID=28141 RepID=UPI000CFB1713|nr:tail fiber domain-containing protein [Cronobacter sakazakii]
MWYREGTITFTQGSDTLEGTGTFWNVTANGVLPGMIVIGPDNKLYEIKRVLNDTRLTLMEQYSGETQNDVPCRIITTYEGDLTQFSARFTALMTRMSADSKTMRSWLTAIDEVTLEREDGTEVTVKSLTQIVNEHNANQQWYRDNTDAIDAAGDKAKQAAASAAAAANSASTAGTKATEASKSAAAAAASESVASEAAKGAKTSETNAESYKETAVASAATATEKAAEAGASASSAAASKNAAKASQTNAAGSAVSAADSATAASNSAAAAEVSESNAAASENAAAGSAAAALASQNAAKTSETNAAQSADGSAASAAAAKVSETNAAASEAAAAASKVAAGLSADAAAGSATTAGEYADAAEASKDAAASSAGEAKKSEASAAASATTATDALAGIEAKATEAAESATLATAKASEASTSAAEAKASQTKAKASEDKAYEYAQNAQSSIASVKWKGTSAELDLTSDTPKWVKVSRARMPQATSTVYIEVIGGAGYDADSPGQAAMADIVLRTAGGDPKGLNAVAYLTQDSAVNSVATVNTDEENYDIYLRVGAGAQKLIVNLQFSGAAVESLEVIESVDSLPEGAVEGMVYHRVLSDIHGAITGSLVGNASTATVLETARKIGGVLFDGSQDIELPGVNAQGNQNTTGNAATATKLQTARRIGGVSFDGSADIDLPGVNAAGNQNTSGNAATATKLQTARKIGGVSFDGSADINLPGVNAAGNQSTTGNAGTATKLQTPRTINSVSFDGSANISIPTLVSRGRVEALATNTQGAMAGLQMYEAYNNSYPTTYGNVIHLKGASASGEGEFLIGWSGTSGAHAPVYVRSRRDTTDANWSGWAQVYTTAHKPTARDVGAMASTTLSFNGGAAGWFKIATVTMPQSTSVVFIRLLGGAGYNTGSWDQATISDLVLRAGNNSPKGITAVVWRRSGQGINGAAWINTSGDSYDIYVNLPNYGTTLNVQWDYTSNAGVTIHSSPAFSAAQPSGSTAGTVYTIYSNLLKPTAADVGALPLSGGTMTGVLTLQNVSQPLKTPGGGILANDGNLYINKSGFAGWIDALFLKNSGGTLTGNLRLSADNASIVCGNNGDIGFIKKQGYPGAIVTGSTTKFMIMRSNAATNISAANTLTEVMAIQPTTNRADFVGEVVSHSANALRAAYGNYGFFIRNDGGTTYFLLTASGDKYGSWNALRPMYINNASGEVTMGNGLSLAGGLNVTSGNVRIPTSSTSWIDMRTNAALSNSSAVATSSASAIVRQEHADRYFMVGGLGNSQFGFYMINKSRTANGTDAQAFLQSDGVWYCGGNGSFNDVYIRSDRRSKRQIRKIERALDKVEQIEGVLYEIQVYDRYEQSGGLIAQDVQKVQPELVTVDKNDQSGEDRLRLNYNGIIGMLVEAVKELRQEVRELREEVAVLKGGN